MEDGYTGEEIVICGMAGIFPQADSIQELSDKLYNKIDMIIERDVSHPDVPRRIGQIRSADKFDGDFYKIDDEEAKYMDAGARILLEKTYEALVDAGMNPSDLSGTNTPVYLGDTYSEQDRTWFYSTDVQKCYGIIGCSRGAMASRISHWLNITGPACNVDTACSSSLYGMELAYRDLRKGHCDFAIVVATNLCLAEAVTLQFYRLGLLAPDGRCKTFDRSADGYVRSEAMAAMILTKAKFAKRIYAELVHVKTNCDGYKPQGITYPSGSKQKQLLSEFYKETFIGPESVAYVECHGTGTKVGDLEESGALCDIFCKNRSKPLPVGSIKTNLGHAEASSGMCSITKVILTFENGLIPANLHFTAPREDIPGLMNGQFYVVTENTPFDDDYVALSGFGFGGANCHILLKRNKKLKVNQGIPEDDLPRVVGVSGRTAEAVKSIFDDLASRPLDVEYIRLYHDIYRKNIPRHPYRGYIILQKSEPRVLQVAIHHRKNLTNPSVWLVIAGVVKSIINDSMSVGALLNIPPIKQSIDVYNKYLNQFQCDLFELLSTKMILNSVVALTAIQMALVDLLKTMNVTINKIISHSNGEITAAYANGLINAKESIKIAYLLDKYETLTVEKKKNVTIVNDQNLTEIARIFLTSDQDLIKSSKNPFEDYISTLSSPKTIQRLSDKDYNHNGLDKICLHNGYEQNSEKNVFHFKVAKTGYNFKNIEQFKNEIINDKSNLIVIGLSPIKLMKNFLNGYMTSKSHSVSLLEEDPEKITDAFGRLFTAGLHPYYTKLYSEVEFPVSRGTPMISPLVKWDHRKSHNVYRDENFLKKESSEREVIVSLSDSRYESIAGHIIDGRNLYPATGYLILVWDIICEIKNVVHGAIPVEFEDIRYLRATHIPNNGLLSLTVAINPGTHKFEICENESVVVTGYIRQLNPKNVNLLKIEPKAAKYSQNLPKINTKDIYKELRLRGYNYQGKFKGILEVDEDVCVGEIKWTEDEDWTAFMDNMLQLAILQEDRRFLYVPTSIRKLVIYPIEHRKFIKNYLPDVKSVTITNYKEHGLIKGGGIEIYGLNASTINRRRNMSQTVLETQNYAPFISNYIYQKEEALRIIFQLALEINPTVKVKLIEVSDDKEGTDLSESVLNVLNDLPLIQSEIIILTKKLLENLPKNISFADRPLSKETDAVFVIGHKFLSNQEEFETATKVLRNEKCFIISRESITTSVNAIDDYDVILELRIQNEKLVALRKKIVSKPEGAIVIEITQDMEFNWLEEVKKAVKTQNPIILYSQNQPLNGLIGLTNCLAKEPGGMNVQCVFIDDLNAPSFDSEVPFYKTQLDKGLKVNILKNGVWGCLRHFKISNFQVESDMACAWQQTRGDLSSFTFMNLPFSKSTSGTLIDVYYAAINFRDVMTASGKLNSDFIITNAPRDSRIPSDIVQGIEFAGRDANGKRWMGVLARGALANRVVADDTYIWEVPDSWSLEDAATIPVVYSTLYHAFSIHKLEHGKSILIHSGTGGIGLAAIHLAMHHGCEIFTTVGTPEKREFLRKYFPAIKDSHIGCSRDTSFEQMIMNETDGRGVDYIINSLAEEKLQASVRCLAENGKFIEIGKYDLQNNNKLGMEVFLRGVDYAGVMFDSALYSSDITNEKYRSIHEKYSPAILRDGIQTGVVKPIPRTTFGSDEIEAAFRYMATGKHIGKVLLKMREEEKDIITPPSKMTVKAFPKVFCERQKVTIIIGGLGGFGLELSEWLIERGCRNLVLSSRTGLKNGYQIMKLRSWREYGGVNIQISTDDVSTEEGCRLLLKLANEMGTVESIFNLAAVLRDALIENQTVENFRISLAGKAMATKNLDILSRELCPDLEHFVVFSSVSCGRGNAGQTNYGMANSIMERICEQRKTDGLPALAIQWGAIGEVGLVADMQENDRLLEIGGTLQQNLRSCFDAMDVLLNQSEPVVGSMVVAEKRFGFGAGGNLTETIFTILGVRDIKTISPQSTLAELGMDSMMAVEIKQTLEREYDLFFTTQEIQNLTYAKLNEIQATDVSETDHSEKYMPENLFKLLLQTLDVEMEHKEMFVHMNTKITENTEKLPPLFIIPGIDGNCKQFEHACTEFEQRTYGVQIGFREEHCIYTFAKKLLPEIKSRLKPNEEYNFVAHSMGTVLAIEIGLLLEQEGYRGKCVFLDGSPKYILQLRDLLKLTKDLPINVFETTILMACMTQFGHPESLMNDLLQLPNLESRIELFKSKIPAGSNAAYAALGIVSRFKSLLDYQIPKEKSLAAKVLLIRPTLALVSDISEDYDLKQLATAEENIFNTVIGGTHISMMNNHNLPNIVNEFFIK